MTLVSSRIEDAIHAAGLRAIFDGQQDGGGYLACPNMPDYHFSWFRDGAFIAYALTMDGAVNPVQSKAGIAGQWDSALKFHEWCVRMIDGRTAALERTIARAAAGEPLVLADTLNARYSDEGTAGPEDWPEFQLDGPGLWLWSLAKYVEVCRMTAPLPVAWAAAVDVTARYLAAVWRTPCYDCWEERGSDVHTSTLAAIYTGLAAAERLVPSLNFEVTRREIMAYVLDNGVTPTGELTKSIGIDMVDANLLLAALPDGGMFAPTDPLITRTVARIERELVANRHGVHRHLEDTYYGGGAWVLLGLWLAWHYTHVGNTDRAAELVAWARSHADADGFLPEQVNDAMLAPSYYDHWVEIRGEIALPLLWSHAKYILATQGLR